MKAVASEDAATTGSYVGVAVGNLRVCEPPKETELTASESATPPETAGPLVLSRANLCNLFKIVSSTSLKSEAAQAIWQLPKHPALTAIVSAIKQDSSVPPPDRHTQNQVFTATSALQLVYYECTKDLAPDTKYQNLLHLEDPSADFDVHIEDQVGKVVQEGKTVGLVYSFRLAAAAAAGVPFNGSTFTNADYVVLRSVEPLGDFENAAAAGIMRIVPKAPRKESAYDEVLSLLEKYLEMTLSRRGPG